MSIEFAVGEILTIPTATVAGDATSPVVILDVVAVAQPLHSYKRPPG
jgi:hypothetical protein